MSARLRVLDTGIRSARSNIALTAALAELHRNGVIADTLRFHRYPRAVLIGRHQVVAHAADMDACEREGIEIARRVSGGGAVFMGPGILAWDLVAERHRFGSRLDQASSQMGAAVAAALSDFGIEGRYAAPGGVTVGGRKVSGSAGAFEGTTLVLQGTLVLDWDPFAARFLGSHSSGQEPVVNVAGMAQLLGRAPPLEAVTHALRTAFARMWDAPASDEDLGVAEAALAQRLLGEEIGTDAFVYGRATDKPVCEGVMPLRVKAGRA